MAIFVLRENEARTVLEMYPAPTDGEASPPLTRTERSGSAGPTALPMKLPPNYPMKAPIVRRNSDGPGSTRHRFTISRSESQVGLELTA